MNKKINGRCFMGGCDGFLSTDDSACEECLRCGFNPDEDERRKSLPLVLGKDGLMRKIVPSKKMGRKISW